MAERHRRGAHGVDDGVFGRGDAEGGERCRVVGDIRRDGAFQRVAGIGAGIDHWHVDAFRVWRGGACKVASDVIGLNRHRAG